MVPPSKSMLATAESAVATTTWPSPRTAFIKQLSTKVFPVPPGASRQKRRSDSLSLRARGHHRVEEGALLGVEEGDSCPCFLHLLLGVEGQPLSCKESLGVGDGRHCNRKWEIEGGEVLGVDQQLILQPSEEPGNAVWQKYLCNFGPVLSFCNAAGSGPVFNQLVPVTIIVIIISLMMENNNLWSE